MSSLVKLILVGLSCYTVGSIAGPIAVGSVTEARETLSPFLLISLAILIASIGYAVGAILRLPPSRGAFTGREESR